MLPIPVSLDFQRDYKFSFLLFNTNVFSADLLTTLVSLAGTAYISQMAQKVSLPPKEIRLQDVPISIVQAQVPIGVSSQEIVVDYLEDSAGIVYAWHQTWQEKARSTGRLTMNEMGSLCMSLIFANTTDIPGFAPFNEIPVNATVYKNVFPYKIVKGTFDKSGQSLAMVRVHYARFVRLKIRGSVL